MASWAHTYREGAIPGPNPSGVITEHKPGQKLAKAVTEIQERVVVDLNLDLEGIIDNGSDIENNTLNLRLETEGTTQTIFAVAGGEWPTLNVQELEVENGLIKSVGDGQELYPDKELATGDVLAVHTGEWPNLKRKKLVIDEGLVSAIEDDGDAAYPNKELFTGEVITSATLSYSNDKLTLTLTKNAVDAGLVVGGQTTQELEVTITIPDPLPPGGTQYQVLQRDEAGDAVWDYVRAVEVT